ncbi:MAG: enoyl-CoA hydratase-related protein [Chloroflexota bacterium]
MGTSTGPASHPLVVITRKESVVTITLNRPEKLNALSKDLFEALVEALREVAQDSAVRAVVITGAGRSFSAGADVAGDIARFREMGATEFTTYVDRAFEPYRLAYNMGKPVIAAMNGHALGAGFDLALSCDIRIAAEDAKMGALFVRMGLSPEMSVYMMPRLVGMGKAKLLAFTGDMVTAQEAERMGLVDMVVPADRLMPEAEKLARRLAQGPAAIPAIKKAINESQKMTAESLLDYIVQLQYHLAQTEDHREAVTAFLEKRTPSFKWK